MDSLRGICKPNPEHQKYSNYIRRRTHLRILQRLKKPYTLYIRLGGSGDASASATRDINKSSSNSITICIMETSIQVAKATAFYHIYSLLKMLWRSWELHPAASGMLIYIIKVTTADQNFASSLRRHFKG